MTEAETYIANLRAALEHSIGLQSHYARQLNMYDGGKRVCFANAEAWIRRLAELRETGFSDGANITLQKFAEQRDLVHYLDVTEEERQMIIRSLAVAALKAPGFDYALTQIALKMDNHRADGKPQMYEQFKVYLGEEQT